MARQKTIAMPRGVQTQHYLSDAELDAANPISPNFQPGAVGEEPAEYPRTEAPARLLLLYLARTGLVGKPIRELNGWLTEQSPDVTAEHLYDHMNAVQFKMGSVRRACKWIWGPTHEPASLVQQAPADELLRLRSENERLLSNNQNLAAEKLGLQHRVNYLQEQLDEATRKVSFLSIGKPRADLDTLKVGVNPPHQSEEYKP